MSDNLAFNNRLETYKGNTKSIVTVVYDPSNNLYDLTGYDAYLYGKKYPIKDELPLDISINATNIDPSNGAILFDLTTSDLDLTPGDYVYEIIIDNGETERHTVVQDRINIIDSIS